MVLVAALAAAGACGAADESIDPGDLELRDLLGVAPRVAVTWNDAQRAAARQVLAAGLSPGADLALTDVGELVDDAAVVHALTVIDDRLLDQGLDAVGLVVIDRDRAPAAGQAIEALASSATLRGERGAGGGDGAATVRRRLPSSWIPGPGHVRPTRSATSRC